MKAAFLYHSLRRDISNFSLLKHRHFDGFMVSMHQSGTHWLKHILASALSHKHGLPAPRYSHANEFIGGIREKREYPELPHIVSTHSIPHILLRGRRIRNKMKFPPYLVLVRDIRASLVSNYEKWKAHYSCGFSEYLRGDVSGHRFDSDIWWCIRFCNAWGVIAEKFPQHTMVLRYEALRTDTLSELVRINRFWSLGLSEKDLEYGIAESSKEKMAEKKDPATPLGLTVVREDSVADDQYFDPANEAFFRQICEQFLRYGFNYDYQTHSS